MTVAVTGSMAYDYIMSFPGRFVDHILPDQIEILRTGNKSAIRDELTAEATAHPECAKKHVWAPYGLMT